MGNPAGPFLTDFYQITMAYAYWKSGRMELPAVFTLYFRSLPFRGGYAVAAGLEPAVRFLESFRFGDAELRFLAAQKGASGSRLFPDPFLASLGAAKFQCDVEAVPEGTPVFPNEPVLKVRGPIWQCQWIETALLNLINFQTLIATKASRIADSARGAPVLEFGLRRAQGPDGAFSAARAAYLGGADATSNVQAAQALGIPLRGTHAHSWIMAFDSEEEAFRKYADAFPDDCVLLVDTYDTLQGVRRAAKVGAALAEGGHRLVGIRLDSGDFAYLSTQARQILDGAGCAETGIFASNELDEHLIESLHHQGARIDAWGVGTKLVTAEDQPALNGVYKLVAIRENGRWKPRIKVSDQPSKTSNPGIPKLRRLFNRAGVMEGDLIYDESESPDAIQQIVDPLLPHRSKKLQPDWSAQELLVPVFRAGKLVYELPGLEAIRTRRRDELAKLHPGIKRLQNPHTYPVGLSPGLSALKAKLIEEHIQSRRDAGE